MEKEPVLLELKERGTRILHKFERATTVFEHLDTPGWVEENSPQAVKLRLTDPESVIDNLTRPVSGIIAIKRRLRDGTEGNNGIIRRYFLELVKINEQISQLSSPQPQIFSKQLAETLPSKIVVRDRHIKKLPGQPNPQKYSSEESKDYLDWLDIEEDLKRRKPKHLKPINFRMQNYEWDDEEQEETDKNPPDKKFVLPVYIIDPETKPARDYSKLINHPDMQVFLDGINNPSSRTLLEKFLQSKEAVNSLNAIAGFFQQPEELSKYEFFNKAIAGAIFAELGYLYLAPLYEKQNRTLLSPEETLTLFRNAKRKNVVMDNTGFGLNRSLMGQTSPDGIVVARYKNGSSIKLIVDYKLGGVPDTDPQRMRQLGAYNYLLRSKNLELDKEVSLEYLAGLINLMRPGTVIKPLTVDPNVELSFIYPDTKTPGLENIPVETRYLHSFIVTLVKILREPANPESSTGLQVQQTESRSLIGLY